MSNRFTETVVSELAEAAGFEIVDREQLPGKTARYGPVPSRLDSAVSAFLASNFPAGLYAHQAEAIEAVLDGQDVCLATSTASGKSLVFMSVAAHILQREPSRRVLALYPARALIQDQMMKWKAFLGPLDLRYGYIDGAVPIDQRQDILRASQVVLMTPDVAHAWLMANLGERHIRTFLADLRLLVLDEAHVYEGVFGTNMAYFLSAYRLLLDLTN